ncbi:MAG: ABC transporter substrate-binding protein [Xanthobacteraceae bacterium]
MRRRDVFTLLGGVAATWPLPARAQQRSKAPRIGMLLPRAGAGERESVAAGVQRLRELGWRDGENVHIDYRWISSADDEQLQRQAAELVATAPELLWVLSNPMLAALQRTTRSIPTVFVQVADPVGSGFVESLARPGGNTTGFTNFENTMAGKWLELLHELQQSTTRALILLHPETAAHRAFLQRIESAAKMLGIAPVAAGIRGPADVERVIVSFTEQPNGGMIALPHPLTSNNRDTIIALAARHQLPAIYPFRYFATAGGVVSYGSDAIDLWQSSASYVDRILRGAKPADLPVQAPSKFELVINLKTAKALGLEVPPTLLARADEVIE